MDRVFSGVFGRCANEVWPSADRGQPALNVWESDDALCVEVELPGVESDQIDISVAGGELSLTVQRPEVKQEGVTYHRRERRTGSFSRTLRLPGDVDPARVEAARVEAARVEAARVEAALNDGVLKITLPKAESAKPRKIDVTTGS